MQADLVLDHYFTGLAAHCGAYDACLLELVHESSGAIVAYGKLALDERCGTALVDDNQAGGIFEERIEVLQVYVLVATVSKVAVGSVWFGQFKGHVVALLVGYEIVDALHLRCVDEGTLHAHWLRTSDKCQQVAAAYELLGTGTVEDSLRVDACRYLEGDAGGEVGLDVTGNDARSGSLGSDDHVYAYGTCQLAMRAIGSSISLPAVMMRSPNSSMMTTI